MNTYIIPENTKLWPILQLKFSKQMWPSGKVFATKPLQVTDDMFQTDIVNYHTFLGLPASRTAILFNSPKMVPNPAVQIIGFVVEYDKLVKMK